MDYVIGSGSAGISAAIALLNAGQEVTMLDAGLQLEPHRQQLLLDMQQCTCEQWSKDQIDLVKAGAKPNAKGVPIKLTYGSDYPYREAEEYLSVTQTPGVDLKASFALGGFSNIWGSALLPYRAEDIADWPIGIEDLADHYRAVLSFMKMAAQHDDLELLFPMYTDHQEQLNTGCQAQSLMSDLSKNRDALRKAGIYFGAST
jgi:choline dehydrogenase-like flavoprotein